MISPAPGRHHHQARLGHLPPAGHRRRAGRRGRASRSTKGGGYLTLTRPWPSMLRGHLRRPRALPGHLLEPLRGPLLRRRRRQARRGRLPVGARPGRRRDEHLGPPHLHHRGRVRPGRQPQGGRGRGRRGQGRHDRPGHHRLRHPAGHAPSASDEVGEELRQHVANKIGAISRPKTIIFTDDLPKTRSGKIMRRLLPRRGRGPRAGRHHHPRRPRRRRGDPRPRPGRHQGRLTRRPGVRCRSAPAVVRAAGAPPTWAGDRSARCRAQPPAPEPANTTAGGGITRRLTLVLAVAGGLTAANLYYAQPLLHTIGDDFGTSEGTTGLVVTASQVGYALGLAFVVPDRGPRRPAPADHACCSPWCTVAMAAASVAPGLWVLVGLLGLAGLGSVTAQVLVPLAAGLATDGDRGRGRQHGHDRACCSASCWPGRSSGAVAGARRLAGHVRHRRGRGRGPGRRAPPGAACRTCPAPHVAYRELARLGRSGCCATSRSCGARPSSAPWASPTFSVFWTTIAFHLSDAPFDYGDGAIGLLGLAGAAGALCALAAGRLADRGLASPARIVAAVAGRRRRSGCCGRAEASIVVDRGGRARARRRGPGHPGPEPDRHLRAGPRGPQPDQLAPT